HRLEQSDWFSLAGFDQLDCPCQAGCDPVECAERLRNRVVLDGRYCLKASPDTGQPNEKLTCDEREVAGNDEGPFCGTNCQGRVHASKCAPLWINIRGDWQIA